MICLDVRNPVETTARKAAERELRIVKEALRQPDPVGALWFVLEAHRLWMRHLIGGPSGLLQVYVTERFQSACTRGLTSDDDYLADAQRRVELLILEGQ